MLGNFSWIKPSLYIYEMHFLGRKKKTSKSLFLVKLPVKRNMSHLICVFM